jgi:hypothetical protein
MKFKFLFLALFAILISSCEDPIDIDLDQGESQLVVDGFVNNLNQKQTIRLTMSSPYFDNSPSNSVKGAIVTLSDDLGRQITFTEESNGNYTFMPQEADSFCAVGRNYSLSIQYKGEEFIAQSQVNPVPKIDSIISVKEKNPFDNSDFYQAEFFATDFKARRDFYWIRTIYNDTIKKLGNADNISDGSFSGTAVDGLPFIFPIRRAINKENETYKVGDTISMQLLSINEATYDFLFDVFSQTTNGGLFATPPYNVRTNIKNKNTSSSVKAVGWFCASQISSAGVRIKDK